MDTRRQSELFAGRDWLALYQAFTTVNFNASDPQSINQAMRDYLGANYPEDFNDWIESSEFVAIIDLLAWLGGTLAFKTDINARENFLEIAESRESILRLARFLSYNPRRNRPATGLLKLIEVSTDDNILDSTGANLKGVRVSWNNPDDPDWFERFSTVLNSALSTTNQFGTPLKTVTTSSSKTQLYRINCLMGSNSWSFDSPVNGETMDFEFCNGDFDSLGAFEERIPDTNAAFNFFYRNDGNGNGSARTGFFTLFKQGTSVRQSFRIDFPEENQILDLNVAGVNENDVWVQTVTDQNELILNWTKVPAIFSSNITYNDIPNTDRNIFAVLTREEDRASIRFSDGIFGNAPVGNIRVNYRVSNGKFYQIRPQDINRIVQNISYYNSAGDLKNLRCVFSLQETVSNATPRETDEQIRDRAPSIYATQNRMVSGEDYNNFPTSSNIATKIKAVNRIYSGHSRFVDLNDPTSTYTDTVVTGDDGMLYWENRNLYDEIPLVLNKTPSELASDIQTVLRKPLVQSFLYGDILNRIETNAVIPNITFNQNVTWSRVSTAKYSSSGWFNQLNSYFKVGAGLRMRLPNGNSKWVTITQLSGEVINQQPQDGTRGPVTLDESIPSGSRIQSIIPQYTTELSNTVLDEVIARLSDENDLRGFSLWFDPEDSAWIVRDTIVTLNTTIPHDDIIHVLTVEYVSGLLWKISARGMRHVFESERKTKWYYSGERVLDSETGRLKQDSLTILRSNTDLNTLTPFTSDKELVISDLYYYPNGQQEPRRIVTQYLDSDLDGAPDDPESFSSILTLSEPQGTLFWELGTSFGQDSYIPIKTMNVSDKVITQVSDIPTYVRLVSTEPNSHYVYRQGDVIYMKNTDTFYKRVNNAWVEQPRKNYKVARGRGSNTARRWMVTDLNTSHLGPEPYVILYSPLETEVAQQRLPDSYLIRSGNLMYKWKHYAPVNHRIDPSITNIVDIFLLTLEHDFATRLWIANGANLADMPVSPTELDLKIMMKEFENYKMFSDEVIWRPARFKYLFGTGSEVRAKFKVVKLLNSSLADGEIKSQVINAINIFFDASRWDFGETFYYTELAAFIHQQLVGQIGSVVIVPLDDEASFGEGFEIKCRSDEIFISTAQVSDVEIISSNTSTNLRIR